MAGVAPAPVDAACGGGGYDSTALARRAGRIADTIILGRLVEVDANHDYHFELVAVYRGDPPPSPIENAFDPGNWVGIIDIGGCSSQSVEPGGLFVYATGDRAERYGPMQLIFPRVPNRGWIIDHWVEYTTLDRLLGLLGVLPDTSTVDSVVPAAARVRSQVGWSIAFLAMTLLAYWALGKRRRHA